MAQLGNWLVLKGIYFGLFDDLNTWQIHIQMSTCTYYHASLSPWLMS